jgi:hypothetical protein
LIEKDSSFVTALSHLGDFRRHRCNNRSSRRKLGKRTDRSGGQRTLPARASVDGNWTNRKAGTASNDARPNSSLNATTRPQSNEPDWPREWFVWRR